MRNHHFDTHSDSGFCFSPHQAHCRHGQGGTRHHVCGFLFPMRLGISQAIPLQRENIPKESLADYRHHQHRLRCPHRNHARNHRTQTNRRLVRLPIRLPRHLRRTALFLAFFQKKKIIFPQFAFHKQIMLIFATSFNQQQQKHT